MKVKTVKNIAPSRTLLGGVEGFFPFLFDVTPAAVVAGVVSLSWYTPAGAARSPRYAEWLEWASGLSGSGVLARAVAPGVTVYQPQMR